MKKDEYILRSLSKIKHKKWELYVISRILHLLDDPEIEFVCQQLVRRSNRRALTDLFFPQFNLHLEIDEQQHSDKAHKAADEKRSQDIVDATGHEELTRIQVYQENDGRVSDKTLKDINKEIDGFITFLKHKKEEQGHDFIPWDFELKFSAIPHIEREYIDVENGAVFRTHEESLRCFGYTGKRYQKGGWRLKNDPDSMVWFPRLYENKIWDNRVENDGKKIVEKKKDGQEDYLLNKVETISHTRIVFAHSTDVLGKTFYRFKGVFKLNMQESGIEGVVYDWISDRVDLPKQSGGVTGFLRAEGSSCEIRS